MPDRVRWGVLGAANIALKKVVPAMQLASNCEVTALGSRDSDRARRAAAQLDIPRSYGSYEELLADPDIDAIYNPLPNHLHVPWTARAAEAGKHVLCEKPIAISAAEAQTLLSVRDRTGVKIGEAFMVRTQPLWLRVRDMIRGGQLGELRAIVGVFSYFNDDSANVRNQADIGGGALLDVGCYPVTMSRFLFEREPIRVCGVVQRDPIFQTDRLTSAILDYTSGHALFTCSTQLVPFQTMQIFGTTGRLEIQIPFNTPPDAPARFLLDDGKQLGGAGAHIVEVPAVNQYTIQAEAFADAILRNSTVPVTLEDAVANMAVMDAIFRSANSAKWEQP